MNTKSLIFHIELIQCYCIVILLFYYVFVMSHPIVIQVDSQVIPNQKLLVNILQHTAHKYLQRQKNKEEFKQRSKDFRSILGVSNADDVDILVESTKKELWQQK